jgi:hypothetical protein
MRFIGVRDGRSPFTSAATVPVETGIDWAAMLSDTRPPEDVA